MCVWDGIVFLSPVQPNLRDYGCILENQGSVYKRDKSVFSVPLNPTYGTTDVSWKIKVLRINEINLGFPAQPNLQG